MDVLNRWFDEQASTPVGSLALFLLVFLVRCGIDEAQRRRARRRSPHRKVAS